MQDAESILTPLDVPKAVKAQAWDAFESSANEDELTAKIQSLPIPKEAKAQLWNLKHSAALAPQQSAPGRPGDPSDPHYQAKETLKSVWDQMKALGSGASSLVTGIPDQLRQGAAIAQDVATGEGSIPSDDILHRIMNSPHAQEMAKNTITPIAKALKTTAQGAGALVAPSMVNAPSDEDFRQQAQVGGALGAGIIAGKVAEIAAPYAKAGALKVARAVLPSAEALNEMSAANKARALNPTTLQGKADAQAISGEMAQKGQAPGLRAKTIDANVIKDLHANGERVGTIEDRLKQEPRPEFQISQDDLLGEIDAAKKKLTLPKTNGVTARPEAVAQLDDIRSIIAKLPKFIDFDTAIELRRQLDARAEDAGAFGVNADTLKADINRGVANVLRGKLNGLDTELASANHDYSISRKAADMVERRKLGETGKITSGIPGRGGILDDVLATWAGHAMGGPVGGAIAEGINLGRQWRGMANVKSVFQQQLAKMVRPQVPAFNPAGLIEEGAHPMGRPADTSGPIPVPADQGVYRGIDAQRQLPPNAGSTVRPNINVQARVIQPGSGAVHEMPPSSTVKQIPQNGETAPAQRALNPAPIRPSRIERSSEKVYEMGRSSTIRQEQIAQNAESIPKQITGAPIRAALPGQSLVSQGLEDLGKGKVRDIKTGRIYQLQPDGSYAPVMTIFDQMKARQR